MPALVVDIGGTHLRCAVAVNGGLEEVCRARLPNFTGGHSPEEIWACVVSRIADYHAETLALLPRHAPMVIAFPGPVARCAEILDAPTLVCTGGAIPDLRADLSARTGRVVHLVNDVSAAAWYLSTRTQARRFLVVTISSGIGSKLFDRGHPAGVIDDPPWAGEIGHVVVAGGANTPTCGCGGQGHLGVISSGRGIERLARETATLDPQAFGGSLCSLRLGATAATLTNEEHLVPAARLGDAWTLQVLRSATEPLARVLVTMIAGCGLDQVLLIGGFAASVGPGYLEIVRDVAERACQYPVLQEKIRAMIQPGEQTEEACLRGAAVFGRRLLELQ